jgi:hypothetical protein
VAAWPEFTFEVRQALTTRRAVGESSGVSLAAPSACAFRGVDLKVTEPRSTVAHTNFV